MTGDSVLLEYMIDHCYTRMRAAPTSDQQRYWFNRMVAYIARRTPETIMRMEREKGLG